MDAFETIREKVSRPELLAQLAEEATELAHAALKLRRVYDGTNPTPTPQAVAFANLLEEIADVELLLEVLGLDDDLYLANYRKTMHEKRERWLQRLGVTEDGK